MAEVPEAGVVVVVVVAGATVVVGATAEPAVPVPDVAGAAGVGALTAKSVPVTTVTWAPSATSVGSMPPPTAWPSQSASGTPTIVATVRPSSTRPTA